MPEKPLKWTCDNVEKELKTKGYNYLKVTARGSHIVIYTEENGDKIKLLKPPEKLIGYWLLLEKATWERVGGFCNGHLGTDDDIHDKVTNIGIPVGIIEGLYVYHRYRT